MDSQQSAKAQIRKSFAIEMWIVKKKKKKSHVGKR